MRGILDGGGSYSNRLNCDLVVTFTGTTEQCPCESEMDVRTDRFAGILGSVPVNPNDPGLLKVREVGLSWNIPS